MKELGIFKVLKPVEKKHLIFIIIVLLNRIISPLSKRASIGWLRATGFELLTGLEEKQLHQNRIYEAMDALYGVLDEVMERFYQLSEGKPNLLLYDISTTFFEGNGPEQAKHGYSRDNRGDRPQILLALCINEKGFPVYFDIFDGNVSDKSTVGKLLKVVKDRFGVEKAIFIGDRGMVCSQNIEALIEMGFGYIVALKHIEARQLLDEVRTNQQMELFEKRLPFTIKVEGKEKKYVLCGSEWRREDNMRRFTELLNKGEEGLMSVLEMVKNGRLKGYESVIRRAQKKLTESGAGRYFDFEYKDGEFRIIRKEQEIQKAIALCGYYVLETTEVGMPDSEVEENYKKLQQVERIFRELKDLIEIRPVFHWKDRRVRTHIFLCIIKYSSAVQGKIKRRRMV